MASHKKSTIECLKLQTVDVSMIPVVPQLYAKFTSSCCRITFYTLDNLLEHTKLNHSTILKTWIRQKRNWVHECLNENVLTTEIVPKIEVPQSSNELTPVSDLVSQISPKIKVKEKELELFEPKVSNGVTQVDIQKDLKTSSEPVTDPLTDPDFQPTILKRKRPRWKRPIDTSDKHKCTVCEKVLYGLSSFEKHQKKHFGYYYCDFCNAGFFSKPRLINHLFKHQLDRMEDQNLACIMCKMIFDDQNEVRAHMHEFHVTHIDAFSCENCGEKFSTKFNMMYHRKMNHETKKAYKHCNLCYKKFKTLEELGTHKKEHETSEHRDILCTHCGLTFKGDKIYKKHKYAIGKTRSFLCSICQKGFLSAGQLRNHEINVHGVGDSVFICVTCNKKFALLYDLKSHEKSHSDAKSILCPECPMAFKRVSHMNIHIKRDHRGETQVKCFLCPSVRTFRSSEGLRGHLRKVHKMTMNEMYKEAGIPYKGRDILSSRFMQKRKQEKISC